MNEFNKYNPFVILLFFISVITFSMLLSHPICIAVSIASSLIFYISITKEKGLKFLFFLAIPTMLTAAILNPAFNHSGVTIIGYFPNGNPITYESIIYGIISALMLGSIVFWFACFNNIFTSDKIIYTFGKVIPSLSLVISMTLRFIPYLKNKVIQINNARSSIGFSPKKGTLIQRSKNGASVFSSLIGHSLEDSVETSMSMKCRGFSSSKRSFFSIYSFETRDLIVLLLIVFIDAIIIFSLFSGYIKTVYFPKIVIPDNSLIKITIFISYGILSLIPIIINTTEVVKWNYIKSKI